jgi:hypothetical protein
MTPKTSGGITTWSAYGIQIPSGDGQYRLYVNQYEILPSESRTPLADAPPPPTTPAPLQARDFAARRRAEREHARRRAHSGGGDPTPPGYRLLYQDMVPVPNHLTLRSRGRPLPKKR